LATSSVFLYSRLVKLGRISDLFEFKLHYLSDVKDNVLESYILSKLKVSNNTSKQTIAGRFSDIDDEIFDVVGKEKNLILHDVAVSSGVTSLELYKRLIKLYPEMVFDISDIYSTYYYSGKYITRIYDCNSNLVKVYFLNILLDKKLRWKYFLSKILFYCVSVFRKPSGLKKIFLLDSELQQYISDRKIFYINYDIFKTFIDKKYNYVRCMNILNLDYFNSVAINIAIKNIKKSILKNGYLQVGRTVNGVNHISLYQMNNGRMRRVLTINNGSEIDGIVGGIEE